MQNHLAAKMFDGDPGCFLVGNGAAELITALGEEIGAARVGVTMPTFEEYLKRFPHAQVVTARATGPDFETGFEHYAHLLEWVDVLVLVNPENPTGQSLSSEEVLALLKLADSAGKRVILDESFVDFAEPTHCVSLLNQDVLDAFPSTIIVKSISKSYGVPGVRLGILATRDAELLARVTRRLSVWNVNSVGEYFLQIIGKYQAEYADACGEIRAERDRFTKQLDAVHGVRVIPSQANYVLCELTSGIGARELASRLLNEHNVLVKECTEKPGFAGLPHYLRIAVRDTADNEALVRAVRAVLESGWSRRGLETAARPFPR